MNTKPLSILVEKEDITTLQVDAIVNAANRSLLGGGGVDGAIHRAAGPELLAACRLLNGCETGNAKLTRGFRLPAKYIIHAVGPIWQDGRANEASLLRSCYSQSLKIASQQQCESIAFPAISTGVYGFPKEPAAKIAIQTVLDWSISSPMQVIFCCFDNESVQIYQDNLKDL